METVYPDNNELKFREKHFGVIEDILKDEIVCTICKTDLLNEIISKKMIMVHKTHLFLCCYNCFYKLCEGNEYSCTLCKSNKELSNCEKCNLNVCQRCVENYKIAQLSNGILKICFDCKPQILWKQRAKTANVLKIFSSQLDLPNGLLVNEVEREQAVRKYLIQKSKIGQNSSIDNIKDYLCLNFILNSFKLSLNEKLSELSPTFDDTIPINEYLNKFIPICEQILEVTCTTLTDFKRIFNLNSSLNHGVISIMKSLLKLADDNDQNSPKLNEIPTKLKETNQTNQLLEPVTECNKINLRSRNEKNKKDVSKSSIVSTNTNVEPSDKQKELFVVIERLNDSILSSKIKLNNINTDVEIDDIVHPLKLLNNKDDNSSDDTESTRTLRSRKELKGDKKEIKEANKSKIKHKTLDDKSDEEKEIDRLTRFNNISKKNKKKVLTSEDEDVTDTEENIVNRKCNSGNKNTSTPVVSKTKKDKLEEIMNQAIDNIDETDSGSDDYSQSEDHLFQNGKNFFSDLKDSVEICQYTDANSVESDDSCVSDVVNSCLTACNKRNIDYYLTKNKNKQFDVDDMESDHGSDELVNEDNSDSSSTSCNIPVVTRSKRLSPLKISSDSDFSSKKKINGKKRKLASAVSSNDSDSSSKYFKKKPKTQKNNNKKNLFEDLSSSSCSSDDSLPSIKNKRRIIKKLSTDETSENSDVLDSGTPIKNRRKNIHKLKKKSELSQLTKEALREEDLRKKRIEERQKLYNQMFDLPRPMESCKKLVLDFDPKTKKELVTVHPGLTKFLKPHQVEGVKFLWNSVFESLAQIKNGKGSGSIVAHCMGLSKTLQVIALVHTLFKYPETGIKTVLIITPNSTIENWCNEFYKWLYEIPEENNFLVLNFTDSKTYNSRECLIKQWLREHGVLITSYEMYRTVVNHKKTLRSSTISEGLTDPGPDLVICDEGHVLKNQATSISKAVKKIKTLRRIVLTGTPLQNNLKEYHCMLDFIRPNLLGSIKEFTNRFINPITNGQYSDSTPMDVKLMKRRSHVLHKMLEGVVQRFDYSVLTPFLPPKHEYVIYLKLSDIQIKLYQHYLDNYRQPDLFSNYNMLQMIWTHPKLLLLYAERTETKREKEKLKEFLLDDSTSDSDSNLTEEAENDETNEPTSKESKTKISDIDLNWWKPLVSKINLETIHPYSKFIMMFSILKECEEIGDKVLIFSQSLFTLDLIQEFLENAEDIEDESGPYGRSWIQGQDFFRIDGSVSRKVREDCCVQFNDLTNTKLRLLLLSTKAFNLGINLVGANRVIIFDVTWNPSLNVQSIFRVFRFGQNKPCYIYRFVSEGTMEQKMYERQISKLSMAFRVVDEHQINRHFNAKDQEELYEFNPNTNEPKETFNLPKDRLMADLLLKNNNLVMSILEHDSLLQNNEAEELDENDRQLAWEDYEKEKAGLLNREQMNYQNNFTSKMPPTVEESRLFNILRSLYPQASMLQLNDMVFQVRHAQHEEMK